MHIASVREFFIVEHLHENSSARDKAFQEVLWLKATAVFSGQVSNWLAPSWLFYFWVLFFVVVMF
jgi:hypothetical protein